MFDDKAGMQGAGGESWMGEDARQIVGVGAHAENRQFLQRGEGPRRRLAPIGAVDDQLREHRIEIAGDLLAGFERVFEPDEGRLGNAEIMDLAGFGHEIAVGIFGADTAFNGVPAQNNLILRERQSEPGGDVELGADEIAADDHLGHRMLDLQSGIHFKEEEAPVRRENKFDRSSVPVFGGGGEPDGRGAHAPAQRVGKIWGWRLLDDLLKPPLHRAFALEKMDRVSHSVAEHLHLDVPRTLDIGFGVEAAVAEIALRLAGGDARGLLQIRPINLDGVAALPQAGERGPRRVRQSAGGGDKLGESRAFAALQQFNDLRDLGSAAWRRWGRGAAAVWLVSGCWI